MEGVEVPRLPMTSAYDEVYFKGGSPGLVVMGEDSCSEGRGFESRCHILDGHFFTLICCKIVLILV